MDETQVSHLIHSMFVLNSVFITRVSREESFPDALAPGNGTLRKILPPANISIYNRGIWGKLSPNRAKVAFSYMYDWVGEENGLCFFKTTTGSTRTRTGAIDQHDQTSIIPEAENRGCFTLDWASLTREFSMIDPRGHVSLKETTNPKPKIIPIQRPERLHVFWDSVSILLFR